MRCYRVTLLEGTYNIGGSLKVPAGVSITGIPEIEAELPKPEKLSSPITIPMNPFAKIMIFLTTKTLRFWWRIPRIVRRVQSIWRKPPIIITVAAADSSEKDKVRANLVCSGVNDEQEIQAALDCHDGTITVSSVSIKGGYYDKEEDG